MMRINSASSAAGKFLPPRLSIRVDVGGWERGVTSGKKGNEEEEEDIR